MSSQYINLQGVISLIANTPQLQNWHTYDEIVSVLAEQYPNTPRGILYGLCKHCRNSDRFDSVIVEKRWHIKFIK